MPLISDTVGISSIHGGEDVNVASYLGAAVFFELTLPVAIHSGVFMVMAVIAPEMVILWALRQWLAARDLAERHHESMFIFSSGLSSKFTDIRYLQNTNGRRPMVFLLSWEGLSLLTKMAWQSALLHHMNSKPLHGKVTSTFLTSPREKYMIGAKGTHCRKDLY